MLQIEETARQNGFQNFPILAQNVKVPSEATMFRDSAGITGKSKLGNSGVRTGWDMLLQLIQWCARGYIFDGRSHT